MTPMQIASLEILEQAQFSSAQARAIARVLEADAAGRREDLATKADLKTAIAELRGDLRVEIHDVKSELVRWVFLAVGGQLALSTGITYFLLQNAR